MRSIMIRGIFAATAALAVACSSTDSTAPASAPASARRAISPGSGVATVARAIDQYVWYSCGNDGAGETIHVTGELRYDFQSIKDSSGVYHLSIKSNTLGVTGVGLTSGEFFRGLMTERVNAREDDNLSQDIRAADIIRFVALGSGDSFSLMVSSRFVVDEGEFVLYEQTWNEVCR